MLRIIAGRLILLAALAGISCCQRNKETGIYLDYRIWGEEGNDSMMVLLQFRKEDAEGATIALQAPAKVELDGQPLREDSAKMTGPFYETARPAGDFSGQHSLVFTGADGKQYREEFFFRPVYLKTPLPEEITRGGLVLELEGLDPEDYVRVLLTDTTFTGKEINRLDTVKNGRVTISKQDLGTIASGPVYLELHKEYERPVKDGPGKGGRLSISYGLKRAFVLSDQE